MDYVEYREAWRRAYTEDPPIPLNVDIELASLCDLRCPFCYIPNPKFEEMIHERSNDGRPRARLMEVDMALRVIDEAAAIGVPALKFNWRGESTLHPQYSLILDYAKRKLFGADGVVFNAGSVDDPFIEEKTRVFQELLINSNFNFKIHALDGALQATKIMVSLDSLVPETHRKMRVGADLARVKANIKAVLQYEHPNVWLRRVVCSTNKDEDFYGDCQREFGRYGKFHVSQHMVFDRNVLERYVFCGQSPEEAKRTYCGYPSQRIVISSSGLAMPCCLALYENLIVGDFNKQSLMEIWNGGPMRNLREVLRANDATKMGEACRKCESWMAFDVPQRKYVGDVELKSSKQQQEQIKEVETSVGTLTEGGY